MRHDWTDMCMQDLAPVQAHQPCKSITVEDSFKSCTSLEAAATVIGILAPDLLFRLREEFEVSVQDSAPEQVPLQHVGPAPIRCGVFCPEGRADHVLTVGLHCCTCGACTLSHLDWYEKQAIDAV